MIVTSYYYKIFKDDKLVDSRMAKASRKRSFTRQMRLCRTPKGSKYYLKVYYGTHRDCFNKLAPFINEGWYSNKKDWLFAYKAFDKV